MQGANLVAAMRTAVGEVDAVMSIKVIARDRAAAMRHAVHRCGIVYAIDGDKDRSAVPGP